MTPKMEESKNNSAINKSEDLFTKPCKLLNSFVNHVGELNEICSKRRVARPDYSVCVTENGKFIMQCKMFDNTVAQGQSQNKKDAKHKAAKAMIDILNSREKSASQQRTTIIKCDKNSSDTMANAIKNTSNVKPSSSIELFKNYVAILTKVYYKIHKKYPLYRCCKNENGEFIVEFEISDNIVTWGKSKLKKDAKQEAAKEMLEILHGEKEPRNVKEKIKYDRDEYENDRRELRNCGEVLKSYREASECQKCNEFIKFTENLSNSTLNITDNGNINPSSTTEAFENYVEKLNKMYFKILQKHPFYRFCGCENGEFTMECLIFDNIVTRGRSKFIKAAKEEAAKKMIGLLNAREEFRNYGEESRIEGENLKFQTHMELNKCAKTLSKSLLNEKENEIVKLNSEGEVYENHVEKLNKISYNNLNHGMHSLHGVYGIENDEFNIDTTEQSQYRTIAKQNVAEEVLNVSNESSSDRDEWKGKKYTEFLNHVKNNSNLSSNEEKNEIVKFSSAAKPFENYVEKLNEIYYKILKKHPLYRFCECDNNEFIMECLIFDNIVTRGQSKFIKDAKEQAAKKMIDLLNNSEEFRNYREELTNDNEKPRFQTHMELSKCAETSLNSLINVAEDECGKLSSPADAFENHVEKLNKISCLSHKMHSSHRVSGIENNEFNIATLKQSKFRIVEKQNVAEKLLNVSNVNVESRNSEVDSSHDRDEERKRKKYTEFVYHVKNNSHLSSNEKKNEIVKFSSAEEPFENYVEKLDEIYYKIIKKHPLYIFCKCENDEYTMECLIFDNIVTRGQSKFIKDAKEQAAKKMIDLLNDREEFRNHREKPKFQTHVEISKCAKTSSKSLINVTKDECGKLSAPTESFENDIEKLNNTYLSHKMHSSHRVSEIENIPDLLNVSNVNKEPRNFEVNSSNDRERQKCRKCTELLNYVKNISKLSPNVKEDEIVNLSSTAEPVKNHVEKLSSIYSKEQSKYPSYKICNENNEQNVAEATAEVVDNSEKMKAQQIKKAPEAHKNSETETDPNIIIKQKNILSASSNGNSDLVTRSNNLFLNVKFVNYVGKLNNTCVKEKIKNPSYTTRETETGEFLVECKMFDKTCTQGCSTTKKDAKQKAAEAMLKVISVKIGIWQGQNNASLENSIDTVNSRQPHHVISGNDLASAGSGKSTHLLKSSSSLFKNHVGLLTEMCIKRMLKVPVYCHIDDQTENKEFVCECKVVFHNVDTVTQGQSINKKDAKQKAAQTMIQLLNESFELEHQTLMESVSIKNTTSYSQQKPTE